MNTEAEVLKWAGQAGGTGVFVYLLIRIIPLFERLFNGKAGVEAVLPNGSKVSWDQLFDHCERQHKAAADLSNTRFAGVERALDALSADTKLAMRDLGNRIDARRG